MDHNKEESVATMISPDVTESTESQQEDRLMRFWQAVDTIRERNAGKDSDEELEFITKVVEEVRQERYDAARPKAKGRR